MFAASSDHSSADGYFRVFDRNATFCTSPFIVVPKVRPKAAKRVEERRHDLFPIGTVRQRAQVVVSRLIDLHGFPVAQRDGRVGQIGVGDDPVGVRGAPRQRSGISQQLLLGLGQGMRGPALDVLQIELIDLQPRLGGQEFLDRSLRETQDLRLDVRPGRTGGRKQLDHLLFHAFVMRVARVLVRQHVRIGVQARQLLAERRHLRQRVGQRGGRAGELALECAKLRNLRGNFVFRGAPGGVVGIEIAQIPLVLVRDLRAVALLRDSGKRQGRQRRDHQGDTKFRAGIDCA